MVSMRLLAVSEGTSRITDGGADSEPSSISHEVGYSGAGKMRCPSRKRCVLNTVCGDTDAGNVNATKLDVVARGDVGISDATDDKTDNMDVEYALAF